MTKKFDDFTELDHYLYAVDWMIQKKLGRHFNEHPYDKFMRKRGGQCGICRSSEKLQFHHPTSAKESDVFRHLTYKDMEKESRNCILVCDRCHSQIHGWMNGQSAEETDTYRDDNNEV